MRILGLLVGLAIGIRAAIWFALPNVADADESLQYLEQAGRIVFGRAMVPWEYQIGARSWIVPALIAPVMGLFSALSGQPAFYLNALHAVMVVLSASIVVSSYHIGRQTSPSAGLWAAGLNAIWAETIYFAPHFLPDNWAAILLIGAMALAAAPLPERRARWLLAGIVFGFAFIVRLQLGFAIATAIFGVCGLRFRQRLLPVSLGFSLPLALLGLSDWITWGAPFYSAYAYIVSNLSGIAAAFGTEPLWYFFRFEAMQWALAAPILVITMIVGGRQQRLPLVVAGVIVATFSAVAHKESRFIYPAIPLLLTVAGIGTARLLGLPPGAIPAWINRLLPGGARRAPVMVGLAGAVWFGLSLQVGLRPDMRSLFQRDADVLSAFRAINADPGACGVGVERRKWSSYAYVFLRKEIGLFQMTPETAARDQSAFNFILANRFAGARDVYPRLGYAQVYCSHADAVCLFKRPGSCDLSHSVPLKPDSGPGVTIPLARLGFTVE